MTLSDAEILEALAEIRPAGRATLRKYLIADQHDRDGLLLALYRDRSEASALLAEFMEVLSVDDDARRRVTRILGEIEAATS
jgi:hypothetical protein